MLNVLGDDYISQHIFYCLEQERKELEFRVYITDSLYAISQRKSMNKRWIEIVKDQTHQETETAQDIINRFNKQFLRREETNEHSIGTDGNIGT